MKRLIVSAGAIFLTGVAIACTIGKTMPNVGIIEVSALDIAIAAVQGYDNPARAAALKNLDSKAISLVGETSWKSDNYVGPVTYKVGSGDIMVTENKPCDSEMKDTTPRNQGGGGGGSGGGYTWYGGRVYGSGGDCLYNCEGKVIVGDIEQV